MGESKGSESSVPGQRSPAREGGIQKLHKGPGELTHPRARGCSQTEWPEGPVAERATDPMTRGLGSSDTS